MHYLLDDSINFDRPVHWIVIYPVDSALLPFNNWGHDLNRFMFWEMQGNTELYKKRRLSLSSNEVGSYAWVFTLSRNVVQWEKIDKNYKVAQRKVQKD